MIRNDHIVQQVVFAVGPDDLFAWLTDPERLASWMGEAARFEPWPGGVFSCLLPGGQVWDGVVVEITAPKRLVFTFGWRDPRLGMPAGMSLVEWDLALHPRGTTLRMTHQHVPAELLTLLNDTWARLFARLRNLLAGRPLGPHPLEKLGTESEAGPA